jgi:hypothetical protein
MAKISPLSKTFPATSNLVLAVLLMGIFDKILLLSFFGSIIEVVRSKRVPKNFIIKGQ